METNKDIQGLSDEQIDAIAEPYAALGGVEDYRSFARAILATRHPAPAVGQQAGAPLWRPTEQQFKDWCERHDIPEHHGRDPFDDAASLYLTASHPPADAAPAWDADATTRLRSIVDLLGPQSCVPDGDLTGYEFAVLGFVRQEIERLKAKVDVVPVDAKPLAFVTPDAIAAMRSERCPTITTSAVRMSVWSEPIYAAQPSTAQGDSAQAEPAAIFEGWEDDGAHMRPLITVTGELRAGDALYARPPVAQGDALGEDVGEPSAREQKLSERVNWNTKQWYEHVGAWENEHDQIVFGSVMALRAMMVQFRAVALHMTAQRTASDLLAGDDIGCLREQAAAWNAVTAALTEAHPTWHVSEGPATGMQLAVTAIKTLAQRTASQPDSWRDAVLREAAKAVLREALDEVAVHVCDQNDDSIRAKGLYGPMADLYAAIAAHQGEKGGA